MQAPTLDLDLYSPAALADSRAVFRQIRDAGPVVWLPRHRMYAMGRFEHVRAALRADDVFVSGSGVAANPLANRLSLDTTLASDAEVHTARRRVLMRSLGAKAITAIDGDLERTAHAVVDELTGAGPFEVGREFSSRLPVAVVSELVGVRGGSERLLRWAAATFQSLGPINRRSFAAMPRALSLWAYARQLRPSRVAPGSWAASVFEAERNGELSAREARALVIDFVAPSLDTTILATNHLVWMLGRNPDAWRAIKDDPSLIAAAVVENVRLASPIRGFTRQVAEDHEVDGVQLPAGSRVAMLFGAANLDERRFPDPETFDLARSEATHLGWGNGPHTCVGIHLAKLEMRTLLQAMVPRVDRIIVGEPARLRNNTLQGVARLTAQFVA